MWKAAETLHVSADDRILLEEFLRSGNTPQKVAFRIRIVLEASSGKSNNELAQTLSTTRVTVLKSLCHPRPRLEIRCGCDCLPEGNGPQTEANKCSGALAKRDRGTLGRKLSPRDSRPCHRAERTTSSAALSLSVRAGSGHTSRHT